MQFKYKLDQVVAFNDIAEEVVVGRIGIIRAIYPALTTLAVSDSSYDIDVEGVTYLVKENDIK